MSDTEVSFAEVVTKSNSHFTDGVQNKEPEHYKECSGFVVKAVEADKRQVTALVSSGILDRYGDIIKPEAFKETLPEYMKNPVILAAHRHRLDDGRSPVVGRAVRAWIDKKGLWMTVEFARTELGEEYWTLYRDKIQRAFSIGYREVEGHNEIIDGKNVNVVTKVELHEVSCVAVPANPEALSKSRQRKLDFVNEKRQQGIFDEEKFLADLIKENPDFMAECEEFAEALWTGELPSELDIDRSEIVNNSFRADGCELTAADDFFADLARGQA